MKMKRLILWAGVSLLASAAPVVAEGKLTFTNAVRKIEGRFEPAQAKPGETVTFKLEVQLNEGWYTYPTFQPDPNARSSRNIITLPPPGDVIFVEGVKDPKPVSEKAEPSLKIDRQLYYPLGTTWEVKAVVSPKAPPGPTGIKLEQFKIIVCVNQNGQENCLPPEKWPVTAALTVLDAPAVAVEDRYREAVEKVLGMVGPRPLPAEGPGRLNKSDTQPVTPPNSDDVNPLTGVGPKAVGLRVQVSRNYQDDLSTVAELIPARGSTSDGRNGGSGADAGGFITFLLTAMFWGGVTLLTPCVFPMIPITVSFFLKEGEKKHHNPLAMASVYALTIVAVLGIAAVALLSVFQELSINPWMNVGLGLLFVFFALSLFGMYEIVLPNSLVRFTSAREGRGGYAGTIFMALSFTIISFTCVAPFLGGFSGMTASGNFNKFQLALGGLAFAATFAAPFFFLALFPSLLRKLPKSGSWMNTVKVVMGFLELAAALKFFRTAELRWQIPPAIFSYDFVLAMWVAILVLMGLYLLNVYRLPHDEPQAHIGVPRMLFGFLSLSLAVYLMPAVFSSGESKPRPGGVIYAWVDSFLLPDHGKDEFVWSGDLRAAVDDARSKKQLVFVDFTGVTCTNCRLNEKNTFPRPEVRELLKKYHLVQLYTDTVPGSLYDSIPDAVRQDEDAQANRAFEKRIFGTTQLPLYVILKPEPGGKAVRVAEVYDEGKINNEAAFVEFLKRPLENK
jgi:thiol:disulfide interchange protein